MMGGCLTRTVLFWSRPWAGCAQHRPGVHPADRLHPGPPAGRSGV